MKLIHLTDTHFVPAPQRLYGMDPRARLKAALESIATDHSDADAIVITGDLCHWGEKEAYEELHACLSQATTPVIMMVGNHDERAALRAVFPDAMDDGNGFVQGSREMAGHTLLFLDTNEPGTHAGHYDQNRLAWLQGQLENSRNPVLLFMHHPAFSVGISSMDALQQQDSKALYAVLEPHVARIRHVFMGHVHRPIFGNWKGMSFSILPSLMHQVQLRLDDHGHDVPGSHEPPAYAVVNVTDEGVVAHLHYFMDRSGRFPLDGAEVKGRDYALNFTPAD
ncbi:phosphodiesterase [Rhizobium sp. 22-785-1]